MGVIERARSGPIALDTAIFIYWIEEHPEWIPLLEPLFHAIDAGILRAVTSELTLLEVLVRPLTERDVELAERYEAILTGSRNLNLMAIDRAQLRLASDLRAALNIRTPDALQIAAAMGGGATVLLTNDRRLPKVPSLEIVQLRDLR